MTNVLPNVISISYAKRVLQADTREHERMREYASVLGSLNMIIFTKAKEGFPDKIAFENVSLYATNSKTKIGSLIKAVKIGKEIINKDSVCDWTVSSQDPFATGIVAFALSLLPKTRLQVQVHGDILNPKFFANKISGWFMTRLGLYILGRAKKIRVVSQRIRDSLLKKGIGSNYIQVLSIQPELKEFFQVAENRNYEHDGVLTVLFVGRFSPEKNISLLLRSAAVLATEQIPFKLVLLGDGPLRGTLKQEVKSLKISNEVSFLGWSDRVPDVMAKADVFCLTSFHEGYAMVLLEAMATGLPVVTTDVGCAGETMKDGVHGIVVSDPQNEKKYAAAIKELLINKNLREELGRNGYIEAKKSNINRENYLKAICESVTF